MSRMLQRGYIWKSLTILSTFIALGAVLFFMYDQRQPLLEKVTGPKISLTKEPIPGPTTVAEWKSFTDRYDWIMGMNIINVDFRVNTRNTTFRYFKNQEVEAAWVAYIAKQNGKTTPLFGPDETINQKLVNLINGQFVCVPITETMASKTIPTINSYATHTCMVPIPPGYGDFVGFVNIFLRRAPTPQEVNTLQRTGEQISIAMYERDIVKATKRFEVIQ